MSVDQSTVGAVIADFRTATTGVRPDTWLTKGSPGSLLLATRDAAAYAEWVCAPRPVRTIPGQPPRGSDRGELRGLVLRGGHGDIGFPADNPWGLPADVEIQQAIRTLWAPFADRAPEFVARLTTSAFALAMVREGEQDHLIYLMASWVSRDVPNIADASIDELMAARELTVGELWGSAPLSESARGAHPVFDGDLPESLEAFVSVHGCLTAFDERTYLDVEHVEDCVDVLGRDEGPFGKSPDGSYAFVARHGEDIWYVLDLAARDEEGEPTVLPFDPKDMLDFDGRERLRDFLAQFLHDMLDVDG